MSLPKSLGAYTDVQAVVDSALAAGSGADLDFASAKEAVRWRSRFYMFRKLYAEAFVMQTSRYDAVTLRNGKSATQLRLDISPTTEVKIRFDKPEAELIPAVMPDNDSPELTAALTAARNLGLLE